MHISRLVDPVVPEIGAAVLDPTILTFCHDARRLLLAEADGTRFGFRHTPSRTQRALDRVRASLTKSQVVLMAAPLVAIALERDVIVSETPSSGSRAPGSAASDRT